MRRACSRRWRLLVLAWIATAVGCRTETTIQERSFPAMAGAMEAFKIRAQAPSSPAESVIIPAVLGMPLPITPVDQNKDAGTQSRRQDVGESTPPLPQVPNLYTGASGDQTISLGDALRLAGVGNPTIGLAEEMVR
ncbi:MAG TPA: hypothetical protein VNX28_02910, partial [Gemmataceae bacterium]|nr:hypothetical protein [Gemmataceae bacterium]